MQKEQTTVIVSVDTSQDEDAQFEQINAQVGEGWRVISKIPISGGGMGPGGVSEGFLRMQVILEREVDENGTIENAKDGDRVAARTDAFAIRDDARPHDDEDEEA